GAYAARSLYRAARRRSPALYRRQRPRHRRNRSVSDSAALAGRRIARVAVAQSVESLCETIAPAPQCGAFGEELVRAAEPGVLKHRKQDVVCIARRRASDIELLGEGTLQRRDHGPEVGEPTRPVGAMLFQAAAEHRLARTAVIGSVAGIEAEDEIGRDEAADRGTERRVRPMIDEPREPAPAGPMDQRGTVGKPLFEIAGNVPRIADHPVPVGH